MSDINHNSENKVATRLSHRLGALCKKVFSLPKTIYLNFRCFDFKTALHLPVLVSYEVRLKSIYKGCVRIEAPLRRFMVKIGFGGTEAILPHRSNVCLTGGRITFRGNADLGAGISLVNSGHMSIGKNCFMNNNCVLWCTDSITIGDDFLSGWDILIRDSDGHSVIENNTLKPKTAPISIGNHVWIASECRIMKGSCLGNDSILAMKSLLNKSYPQAGLLVAGIPAKPVRENIRWTR